MFTAFITGATFQESHAVTKVRAETLPEIIQKVNQEIEGGNWLHLDDLYKIVKVYQTDTDDKKQVAGYMAICSDGAVLLKDGTNWRNVTFELAKEMKVPIVFGTKAEALVGNVIIDNRLNIKMLHYEHDKYVEILKMIDGILRKLKM